MKHFCLAIAFLLTSTAAIAQSDIQIKGQITHIMPSKRPASNSKHAIYPSPPQTITLLKIQLSEKAKQTLAEQVQASASTQSVPSTQVQSQQTNFSSTTRTQLGMNNVPVLDQGPYGTCATFAVTAALDAALRKGDYISQLCTLQLGTTLEKNGYHMSGWQGSFSSHVLNHLGTFGIVNKTVQGTTGCGGLSQYPKTGKIPKKSMPLPSYHANSESLTDNNISWTSLLDRNEFIRQERNPQATLESVKQALRQHDRLVFGVFLFGLNDAPVGASGRHKQANDTWVVTSAIIDEVNQGKEPAGHAMIITGFDDYATAIDQDGVWHQGLLTLRNSWSKDAGDNGNFYMSYDYFKPLTAEIIRIRSLDSASS